MTFRPYYALWAIFLFLVEVVIALYVRDDFIRPYVGDVLVVILIYAVVRALFRVSIFPAALGVLLFAFGVEILQYFKIVEVLGLGSSAIARTVIGTTFVWEDFLAYTIGCIILLGLEKSFGLYQRQ
ncbi:MAG: DUF2809 domain-containing protein [Cyanobacteria bacterium P01_A01_bin.135]